MGYDSSDAALEATYRSLSSAHLKRSAAALELDRARAYRSGSALEAFCERRLVLIRRLLEERGETVAVDGNLF